MDPISQAIDTFQKDFRAFLHDPEPSALHVCSEPKHIEALAKLLRGEEWHTANNAPFLVFPTAWDHPNSSFAQMILILKEHHGLLRKAFADQGQTIPELSLEKPDHTDPLVVLVDHIRAFAAAFHNILAPPLFCWLPTQIKRPNTWYVTLTQLHQSLVPQKIRLVTVAEKVPEWPGLDPKTKDAMATTTYEIDEAATAAHFDTLMGPPAAGRAEGTHPGCAAPDVAPPPRPGPSKPTDEQIKAATEEAGLPPMLTPGRAEVLRAHVLAAAKAAGASDKHTALKRQGAACHLCAEEGVLLEQTLMTMVLASYYLQFNEEEPAEETYREAEALAVGLVARPQLAQIRMALGYLFLKQRRFADAIAAYEQAAAAACIEESHLLYFEALRLAGTAHVEIDDKQAAARCWRAVIEKAASISTAELRASGYRDVAGALIDLLQRNGLQAEAHEIEERLVAADAVAAQPLEAKV